MLANVHLKFDNKTRTLDEAWIEVPCLFSIFLWGFTSCLGECKSIRSCGPGCLCVDGNLGINYPGPLNRWWSDVTIHATIFFNPVQYYQNRTANMHILANSGIELTK
jgi:hypothetical protein